MNHTFRTRSALAGAAKAGLRREQHRQQRTTVYAICAFVIGAYLIASFVQQVLA